MSDGVKIVRPTFNWTDKTRSGWVEYLELAGWNRDSGGWWRDRHGTGAYRLENASRREYALQDSIKFHASLKRLEEVE